MQTQVRFKEMARSESLENYALEKIEPVATEFLMRHDYHLQIWLIAEHSRTNRGAPCYRCEVDVRYPHKREIFISKESPDMHEAICLAADTTKVMLREESKREIHNRHQAIPVPEVVVESEDEYLE
jgi:ribosome-associated translation inhibitor RaiA